MDLPNLAHKCPSMMGELSIFLNKKQYSNKNSPYHYLHKASVQAILELSLVNVVVAHSQKVSSPYLLAHISYASVTLKSSTTVLRNSVLAGHTAMSNSVPSSLNDYRTDQISPSWVKRNDCKSTKYAIMGNFVGLVSGTQQGMCRVCTVPRYSSSIIMN